MLLSYLCCGLARVTTQWEHDCLVAVHSDGGQGEDAGVHAEVLQAAVSGSSAAPPAGTGQNCSTLMAEFAVVAGASNNMDGMIAINIKTVPLVKLV